MNMLPSRLKLLFLVLGLGCFLAPIASLGQAYLDNNTLYSNQDPNNETRRSDHFRINFGHYNRDFGAPVTEQLVQGNLQMFEHLWQRNIVELGLADMGESAILANRDGNKYRTNFNILMTWNDGGGGGAYMSMDGRGYSYAMANSGYCRYDPPSGATPHELGHAWEGQARGFNGSDSSGAWWECTANWFQQQLLNSYPTDGIIYNGMYYPVHGRDYYGCFTIWETFREDPRYGGAFINNVWTNATEDQQAHEFIIDRMVRLDSSGSPDKAGASRDMWGDMAKKRVTWDFERQRWLAQENMPETDANYWGWYQRCRTPLVKMAGSTTTYRPERSHIPMQYGFNIIQLVATPGNTVSCNFQPQCDPVRQSDWRACLVAVSNNNDARYSTLWNKGTNSIKLALDENKVYLVVTATPKPMKTGEWNAYLLDNGLQFPYSVSFTNATPKHVVYPTSTASHRTHANGGGFVQTSATVDATAYVGPNAMVLDGAKVLGNARVEDYAVVRNSAQVRDNAVISGHAVVQDSAQVYGNAKVRDWARVFGNALVYENAKVIEHANCGDSGNVVFGNAIIKGTTYVYSPSTFSGSVIVDGDSANGGTGDHGVHFGWQWGQNQSIFTNLTDNLYIYAQHSFERENAVFAMDQYGINHGFLMNGCRAAKDTAAPTRGGLVLPMDGVSQYVELHNSVNDFKDTAISIWVKWTGTANDQRIWSMGNGSTKYMYLTPKDATTGKLKFVITNGAATETLDGAAALTNAWTNVTVLFSSGTSTLYVNGAAVATNAAATIFPEHLNAPLMENANYLGRGNAGNYFQGYLDDFRVYMKALTAAEVTAIYSAAAPAVVTITADTTAPTPDAATWLVAPYAISDSTVTMSATPGTDASNWVEYYFQCTSGGGHDSGWVSFHRYTDVGLTPGTTYTYTVKMRDKNGNTTADSAAASITTQTYVMGAATFAFGPVGIADGQITMTAAKQSSPTGLMEYKFNMLIGTGTIIGSSGWQASPSYTFTSGMTTGSVYSFNVQMRDGKGNLSSVSGRKTATAKDMAAPQLAIPVANWGMMPYATIDNKISMTAFDATDLAGVQYSFECVEGGGPNSGWQDSTTYLTPVLADGTYKYRYKTRDKSAQLNESGYSTTYSASIKPTTGYHNYALTELALLADDTLAVFTGVVTQINYDSYIVSDIANNKSIKVYPNTYGMVTDSTLLFKQVNVSGHLWTFGATKTATYSTVTLSGTGSSLVITGKVTNSAGVGISGATVYFAMTANPAAAPVCTAKTDGQGNYSRTVIDGTWYAAASADDYYPSADQSVIVAGANVPNVNFALNLAPKVTGRVTDVAGIGISGATVYFSKTAGAVSNFTYKATTDSRGNYIKGIPDGTWYMAASAGGYTASAERTVVVAGYAISGIDFTLTLGGDGLKGEYFDNNDLTTLKLTKIDPIINFDYSGVAPDPSIGTDDFSIRWSGSVKPKYTQTYTFYTTSDDGVRLWVNDQLLIDNWNVHGATVDTATIDLNANQWYKIRLEYYQGNGSASIKLEWSSASQGRQIIPAAQLCSLSDAGYIVYGQVTDDVGSPVAGAAVYFSASPNASSGYAFGAMTDFQGRYSRVVPNGTWYVAAGKANYITSADQTLTMNNANLPNINFSLTPTVIPVNVLYNFDEAGGNIALDSAGSGKDGTLINDPARAAGKINGALNFDGANDYVSVPALSDYNAITVAGWINMDSFGIDTTGASIFSSDGTAAGSLQFTIVPTTKKLRFGIAGNTPAAVDSDFSFADFDLGKWRHVAVVYESAPGTVKFYVNGGLKSTKTFSGSRSALLTGLSRIGGWSGGRYFDGIIDDFRLYRKALSDSEIVGLVASESQYTIGTAKKLQDGELVAFAPKPVTFAPRNASSARTTNYFYIEEPNRSSGIRVMNSSAGPDSVSVDYATSVAGYLLTNPTTGEKYIELSGIASAGAASKAAAVGVSTRSITNSTAALGMLVRVAGKVTSVAPDGLIFKISDGLDELAVMNETGTPITNIAVGNTVAINGIVSQIGASRVLLLRQLNRLLPPEDATYAFYKFNETSGTSAADSSGNNLTATLLNGPTWLAGKYGNAINLDGTNDYVSLPTGIVKNITDCTISTWVKLDANANWNRLFDIGTGTTNCMFFTPKSSSGKSRFAIKVNGSGEQQINGTAAIPTGSWQHVTVTLSGSVGILYMNGVEVARNSSMTFKPSGLGNTNLNYIGKSQYADPYFDGIVDDFRIYDKALIAADVLKLYNGQLD